MAESFRSDWLELPESLAERTRPLTPATPLGKGGELVLYWMHHAVRGHENPALEVAIRAAVRLGLPMLVYQGLGGKHPHNALRHHLFILQGARDAAAELRARGIRHVMHLPAGTDEPGPLRGLVAKAAVLVVEDFPAPPFPAWTGALAGRSAGAVLAVDCACVVPMQLLDRPFDRAFRFRQAMEKLLDSRLGRPLPELQGLTESYRGTLGFEPLDLPRTDLMEAALAAGVDASPGPVWDTPGGSRAGYARWRLFREQGLARYAELRNDATVQPPLGVSRLSPYLHHGHISPFRISREAADQGGSGSRKFLDELLIWRELSYNFCRHQVRPGSIGALPAWAQETLSAHQRDPRPELRDLESLERGASGDVLWDLAQLSLLRHGELHNNLRMTWGKALLPWSANPAEALSRLIDLNDRHALDGSDPNSYGGLLWCLGLFDRPFKPETPILGLVRGRSTTAHRKRLDLPALKDRLCRPARGQALTVAVVGAGVAGTAAARLLQDQGMSVVLLDKARGIGGRTAQRRIGEHHFDHGAQYLTIKGANMRRYLPSWLSQGVLASWQPQLASQDAWVQPRYVGTPGMNALARHLAAELAFDPGTQIASAAFEQGRWLLRDATGGCLAESQVLVLAVPAPQAAALLDAYPRLQQILSRVSMGPCWSGLLGFSGYLDVDRDALAPGGNGVLQWLARNNSKAGRPAAETWTVHASPAWSREHLESDPAQVTAALLDAFRSELGIRDQPIRALAHRWRYARTETPLGQPCLWVPELRLAVCGDWCLGERVEHAYESGLAAAGRVMTLPPQGTRAAGRMP